MTAFTTNPPTVQQLRLPRQTEAAAGPIDMIGMYLMHFAIRRDLDTFVTAVANTPVDDRRTWHALTSRWNKFSEALHDHHTLEDAELWPRLELAVKKASDDAALGVVSAMEAEHAEIDPLLESISSAFDRLASHEDSDMQRALEVRMASGRERLLHHMQHEEQEALPLVQQYLTTEDWEAMEKGAKKQPSKLPFFVPWVLHDMPSHAIPRIKAFAGRPLFIVWTLFRRRFERQERRAFRYV